MTGRLRELLRRLLFAGRARRFSEELDAELQFHIDMRVRALEAEGWPAGEARRQAHLELGNRLRLREDARDVWLVRWWQVVRQDLAFGWRMLRRTPTLGAAMVLTLALGVGANTAIFSIVNAVLLKPLPYAEPDRLVLLWATTPGSPATPLTPGNFYDFRTRLKGVTGFAGVSQMAVILTGRGPAARLSSMSVSSDFFEVLGASAAIGRTFDRRDGPEAKVVVLSHRLWSSRFAGAHDIIGATIALRSEPHVVLGVMPAAFVLPSITPQPAGDDGPELWIPAGAHEIPGLPIASTDDLRDNRRMGYLRAIGRLRSGVDLTTLQAEASVIADDLARRYPRDNAQVGARVVPFAGHLLRNARRPLFVLSIAVIAVLAIACANIAGLLLGRAAARRKELAVRGALGASAPRLARQLLTESLLLSMLSGVCGLAVGQVVLRVLVGLAPPSLLRLSQASIDGTALVFAMGLSGLTGIVFGILPSLQGARVSPHALLAETTGRASDSRSRQRMRRVLVIAEVAIAYLLLAGAAVVGRSLWSLVQVDPGYEARGVLAFEVLLSGPRAEYQRRQVQLFEQFLEQVRGLPGVTAAAAIVNLPVGGDDFGTPAFVEGAPPPEPGAEPRANYQVASAGYFAALRIPLLAGRDFAATDTRETPPVVIVSDSFARRFWADARAALEHRIRAGSPDEPWATIVGVVGDVRHGGPASPAPITVYEPYTQRSFPFMSFVVRTAGDPLETAPAVRRVLAELAPEVPMSGVSSLHDRLYVAVGETRFLAMLLVSLAGVAVLLAIVGVYGVVALAVSQRAREVGIRLALGASRRQVIGLLVGQGATTALIGLVVGIVLWLGVGRSLEGLLFGVTARDVATLTSVAIVIATAALVATIVPVRRSTSTPPSMVLRAE